MQGIFILAYEFKFEFSIIYCEGFKKIKDI